MPVSLKKPSIDLGIVTREAGFVADPDGNRVGFLEASA